MSLSLVGYLVEEGTVGQGEEGIGGRGEGGRNDNPPGKSQTVEQLSTVCRGVSEFENGGREKKMEKKVRTGNKRVECFFKKEKGFAFFLFVLLVGFFTFLFVGFAFDFLLFVGFLLFCWFCFFTFLDHNLC